MQVGQKMP